MNDASCMRPEILKRGLIEVNREDYVRYANELEETFNGTYQISGAGCLFAAQAIRELLARAEKAEKERDAAVDHLRQMCVGGNTCAFCKHGRNCGKQGPGRKSVEHCWEWCGQKEE